MRLAYKGSDSYIRRIGSIRLRLRPVARGSPSLFTVL